MANDTSNPLDEFRALEERRRSGSLSPQEELRREQLQDVLLELSTEPGRGTSQVPRPLRAEAVLDVSFTSKNDVVKAYSKNIGTGGIAIKTARPLPTGTAIEIRVKFPDLDRTINVLGTVVWSSADEMGISFTRISPEADKRFKEIIVQDASFLNRVKEVLTKDVRELKKGASGGAAPKAAAATEVDTRPYVLVRLTDVPLYNQVVEVLEQAGLRVATSKPDARVAVVVVDVGTALQTVASANAKLIMINVSGPDALGGKLASLKPTFFLKRPATAAEILDAVTELLK